MEFKRANRGDLDSNRLRIAGEDSTVIPFNLYGQAFPPIFNGVSAPLEMYNLMGRLFHFKFEISFGSYPGWEPSRPW